MKKFFIYTVFSLLLFISFNVNIVQAQNSPVMPVDKVTKLITYQQVVQVEGKKDELYIRGIGWVNKEFKNPEDVTNVRDRNNGVIKGISRFRIKYTEDEVNMNAGTIEYTFILEFKDGRYRYTFTDFLLKDVSRQGIEMWLNKQDPAYNPRWDQYLTQVDEYVRKKIESLRESMKPPVVKDENW